jgi:FMN phosphatase YigB (HAD superfamily)
VAELPLAPVTNGRSSLQRLKVRRTGLAGYFPVVVAADDIGIGKPGPQIFDAASGARPRRR